LTQTELGERAGMAVAYVSKVELGQKNLTLRTMQKLAEVVDHDVTNMLKRLSPEPK
jgi:transcriptional regulator with XRE-family HTH domain